MIARVPTGIRRLDELLNGGMPEHACALLYGPPFIGKEMLAKLFFLEGMRAGVPGILVVTSECASDVRNELRAIEPKFDAWEKAGLANFVDTYSRAIGAEEESESVEYVDSSVNLNAVALAVNTVQRRLIGDHSSHRLVFDSISTLATLTNAQTTFRFLQVFVGKAKRAGATCLLMLERGMHTDAEVQMFKHLADGVIEMKADAETTVMNVLGLGTTENRGWIEYRFTNRSVDITGSFAAGRIR